MDRGTTSVTTDSTGHYVFQSAYPLGEWIVMEAYNDSFYTTGVTYQADNQNSPTTVKGAGVDVSVLPIITLGGRMDWGVHAYDPTGANNVDPRNGGIVGSVSYDTTRNEFDPQYAASEDWQVGIADVPVELYDTVPCGTTAAPCDADGNYELAPDGGYAKGKLLNTYLSENWNRPAGCTARDVDGNPLVHGVDENVFAPNQATDGECISSFLQSIQFGPYPTDQGTPDANFGAAVDGNYGFGDGCFDGTLDASDPANPVCNGGSFTALGARDYLVKIAIPDDASGQPMYKVTGEEDINIGNGDQIIPQVPPPACAGALHTVDLVGDGTDGYGPVVGDGGTTNDVPVGVTVPASSPVDNGTFLDIGGSPFEGTPQPLCDTKLVPVNNGKSVVPMFNVFTDVPIPARMRGLLVDDTNFSGDKRSTMYGEKAGIPFIPVGIYDFANRLAYTTESDFNGVYDVLMPSTNHISCPTPSGVCANMYRFVANDPGIPGRLNPNYTPRYRTIAADFEAFPGMVIPTDLAPTQVGVTVEGANTGLTQGVTCALSTTTPQLLAVSKPYVNGSGSFTIQGLGFGATKGSGKVTLDGLTMTTSGTWNDSTIAVTVPAGTPVGPHQLEITANNGQTTVNGLTFHVLGAGYNPSVREVGPGKTYATIQDALDVALGSNLSNLVVVYPGTPDLANPRNNPRGAYYENLIVASPVKLQGVGPGGFRGTTFVPGSIIDASAFGGDSALATDWYTKLGSLTWDGNQTVGDAAAVTVLASQNATTAPDIARQFTSTFKASIDGFDLRGGNQGGFPGNINDLTGGPTGLPPNIDTQGGAVYANAYVRSLQVTNNMVQNNGGTYGTVRIGSPDLPEPDTNQHNENVRIADNRIISNGGTNLAGGIGLFAGADAYEVTKNDICGNFSLEYGGGVSVYGKSPGGKIHHNRIYFNHSNDEGGGIMIAGNLPLTAGQLSPGSGAVDIYANQIQANLANDDGGGIRFLMSGNYPMNVYNNMIVNNVSTHEGGGIAIDDAPNVRIYHNTVMKNLTTATAVTSNGQPMPAGLSTTGNSQQLQSTLPGGSPSFSRPLLFNNIFWENRAATRAGLTVTGIGLAGDATPVNRWDMGVSDGTGTLAPTNSIVQQAPGQHTYTTSATNSSANPVVASQYDVSVSFDIWRQNPAFVDAGLVTVEAPPNLLGNYHLAGCPASPACNRGASAKAVPSYQQPPANLPAPTTDFDDQARPAMGGFDSGADESDIALAAPVIDLYYSTFGDENPPGVGGTADDADIYRWNGTAHSRNIDVSNAPYSLPAGANVDGFGRVDATHFYMSFSGTTTTLPGLGAVEDEDVVYYSAGTWSMYFDGTARGLTAANQDIDAIHVTGGTLYFSTVGNTNPTGVGGTADDADIYSWNGLAFARVWDASANGLATGANVDGFMRVDATHFYLSFSGTSTTVPGPGAVQDEDVVYDDAGAWSVFFDGTANGLTTDNLDLDAVSFVNSATPPPPVFGPLSFSTFGNTNPTGLVGTADDADIYGWNGTSFSRTIDVSAAPYTLPATANVDGFDRVDATHFYMSFSGATTTLPGLGAVEDEDVVYYNAGTWSVYFNGTAHGLTAADQDLDAISVAGGTLYFSTLGNTNPPGVAGTADDADIYSWNGTVYARIWDGSANGLAADANIDGYVRVDATHYYMSFSGAVTGTAQDEDVIYNNGGVWSTYFDGTAHGLTADDLDVDAFDVP
jgi:hypothetical protein